MQKARIFFSKVLIISSIALASNGIDSVLVKHRKIVTSDSAAILCPKPYTILDKESVEYAIEPVCPVLSVALLVHYYPFKTDTLARLITPPFSTVWNYSPVQDQDQLQLQFGYLLYHVNGDTIVSAPTPHHWVIERSVKKSSRRYTCKQIGSNDTVCIDGKLDEWDRFPAAQFDSGCRFKCCWTAADFFFAAEIIDTCVTIFDRIEIGFDLKQTGTPFFTIDHRIIAFGPKSRSFCWAIDLADTGSTLLDSIIMLIKKEMEWRSRLTQEGYIIEARIPFFTLSAFEFPPKRFGFDVAVVNRDNATLKDETVYSWSGSKPSNRHSPSVWGTIILKQLFPPLKLLLITSFSFIISMLLSMVFLILYRKRNDYCNEKLDEKGLSLIMKSFLKIIEDTIGKTDLTPDTIAHTYGCTVSELEKTFENELNTSCRKIITLTRIKKAKSYLVDSEMKIEEIAKSVGFGDTATFAKTFKSYAGVSPLQWKENRRKDSLGDEEEAQET